MFFRQIMNWLNYSCCHGWGTEIASETLDLFFLDTFLCFRFVFTMNHPYLIYICMVHDNMLNDAYSHFSLLRIAYIGFPVIR